MNPAADRRFSTRTYLNTVWVRPLSGGSRIEANALHFSRAGLALFAERFLQVGEHVELVLHAAAGDYTFQGQVAQVKVETEGNIIDVAFSKILTDSEMRDLETKLGIKARR